MLSFDMGGTTAKACVIDKGEPLLAREFEVARADRFKKGSGLPIRVPVIEMIEIGAGGGSIARIDSLGLLKVGPDSAGADPGPACYAQGGQHPTVTDADLVLGYLDPDFFLGGRMRLDVNAAKRAIETRAAARIHGIERGKDLRSYPLFAFGGAGPVHAWAVGRILKVPRVLVPFGAGAVSAYGLLAAPLAFDFVRTAPQRLDAADWSSINTMFAEMETEGRAILRDSGVADADIAIRRSAEMRYVGQGHEVEVEVSSGSLGASSLAPITDAFEAAYRTLYSRTPLGVAIEALNWRVVVSGPPPDLSIESSAPAATGQAGGPIVKKHRPAYFAEAGGYVDTPVYDRYRLAAGTRFEGPAIIEERESTTVIGPGARVVVDPRLTIIAEPTA
jgi:N-methylhydantoinase A